MFRRLLNISLTIMIKKLVRCNDLPPEPYSCGVLQSVPQTQIVTVTLQSGSDHTVADSFCLDPEGEYEIKISGSDLTEPIRISEVQEPIFAAHAALLFFSSIASNILGIYGHRNSQSPD